ncbi:hypothetical protein FOL47_008273 [Perkinsus chesapeaki]|uniref:Uncharacterized protein n=1 Tax=Perkinsus chesapeaki TaxID=330153 RepID=A0A7J6MU25_PERCH|nr:hypothetical protein FOL47_008273 [Perkinsus chesapeaki]
MHVLKEKGLLSKGKGGDEHYLPGLIHINPVQIDFNKIGRSFEKRLKKDEDALRGTISGMSGWEEAAKDDLTHLAEEGEKGYLADLNTMPRQAKEAHAEMMRALEGPESSDAIRAAAIGV